MGLNIKNAETERLIAQLAQLEGRNKTAVVTDAVRDRIARLRQHHDGLAERLLAIGADCAARVSPEVKALDHGDYLYDEMGLPR